MDMRGGIWGEVRVVGRELTRESIQLGQTDCQDSDAGGAAWDMDHPGEDDLAAAVGAGPGEELGERGVRLTRRKKMSGGAGGRRSVCRSRGKEQRDHQFPDNEEQTACTMLLIDKICTISSLPRETVIERGYPHR